MAEEPFYKSELADRFLFMSRKEKTDAEKIKGLINEASDLKQTNLSGAILKLNLCQAILIEKIAPNVNTINKNDCTTIVSLLYVDKNFRPSDPEILKKALTESGSFADAIRTLEGKLSHSK